MTIFFEAQASPDVATAYVREVPAPNTLALSALFPREDREDNRINFREIVKTNRTAKFRAFDGNVSISQRDTASSGFVDLLPLSSSLSMGEYERLQLHAAGWDSRREEPFIEAIYNDAENLTAEVQNRIELAWGDVLTDGVLTIDENGYKGEADFGVPENHFVTPTKPWTEVGSDPATVLEDITAWNDTYVETNGERPATMFTSQRMSRLILRSPQVIEAVHGRAAGKVRVTRAELNETLADIGLPLLADDYDSVVDVDGVRTRVLPDNKLFFLPENVGDLGRTAWGVTATALELMNSPKSDMTYENAPGIVAVVVKEPGVPFRQFVYVDAVAMPVLTAARLLLVADIG